MTAVPGASVSVDTDIAGGCVSVPAVPTGGVWLSDIILNGVTTMGVSGLAGEPVATAAWETQDVSATATKIKVEMAEFRKVFRVDFILICLITSIGNHPQFY